MFYYKGYIVIINVTPQKLTKKIISFIMLMMYSTQNVTYIFTCVIHIILLYIFMEVLSLNYIISLQSEQLIVL